MISLDRIVAWQYSAMGYWASDMIASVEGKQSQSVMRIRIKLCCSVVWTYAPIPVQQGMRDVVK